MAPMRLLLRHGAAGSRKDRADPNTIMIDKAVIALLAHRHEVVARPAEDVAIELARRGRIGCAELVPADTLLLARRKDVALAAFLASRRDRLHHIERRTL